MSDESLETAVRRGKQEWEQTFDAIGDPIAVFDARGVLLRGNAALARHVGCDVRELAGCSCGEIGLCGGNCPECAVRTPGDASGEALITAADGQIFRVTTFPMSGGGQGAVVQVAKNVTTDVANARRLQAMSDELALANSRSLAALEQLKGTQAQLLQIEKLSAIGELVAGLAHELNNPLTSIIGYAQLLLDDFDSPGCTYPDPTDIRQDLMRIAAESDRAARIVRNLLSFSRREPVERTLQDPKDLVERTLSLREYALRSGGVTITIEFEATLPLVLVDPGQVQHALLNLLLNAEHAMRDRAVRHLTIRGRRRDAAAAVELQISDTGHGIHPANIGRIFDPFFTTKEVGEGTGLGLSICYGVVRDHGGDISVDSRVGEGTTFTLLLPATRADAEGGRVLVSHTVRDDGNAVAAALEAWGYQVTVTSTLDAALAQYTSGDFDVALIDARVLTGHEDAWSRAAVASAHATPVVILGGDESMAHGPGAAVRPLAIVPGPFQLGTLWSALRTTFREGV